VREISLSGGRCSPSEGPPEPVPVGRSGRFSPLGHSSTAVPANSIGPLPATLSDLFQQTPSELFRQTPSNLFLQLHRTCSGNSIRPASDLPEHAVRPALAPHREAGIFGVAADWPPRRRGIVRSSGQSGRFGLVGRRFWPGGKWYTKCARSGCRPSGLRAFGTGWPESNWRNVLCPSWVLRACGRRGPAHIWDRKTSGRKSSPE